MTDTTTERAPGRALGALSAALRWLGAGNSTVGPLIGLVGLVIAFTILSPVFPSVSNALQVAQQVMEVGTLAVGQALIVIAAGIDLSNGAIMILGSLVMAKLSVTGTPVPLAIATGIALTAGLGLVNGLLVGRLRLPPFIVTLGMLNVAYSVGLLYSRSATITNLPKGMLALGESFKVGGTSVSIGPLVMLGVVLAMWYALRQTAWGQHVYAVGNNPEAARLTGISVTRLLVSVYLVAGFIYGVTALLVIGRTTVADPNGGLTDNLDSITAVVIGGISLFGGRGSVVGALIGALIVGVIRNGLTILGVDALYQTLATGILVVAAVAFDRLARRRQVQ